MVDDAVLAERAAAGDEDAFEVLVRRHAPAAWRLARTLLQDDFAADEAVQDTFLKVHRAVGSFRREAAFATWLLTICRRVCLDRLRLVRSPLVSLDEARELRAREEDSHLRLVLEAAVARLDPVEREAFTLVDVLGYTREDAASIVGVPASTMRSRVSRARDRLAAALEGDLGSAQWA